MKAVALLTRMLAMTLLAGTPAAIAAHAAHAATDPERASLEQVLDRAGFLADPFAGAGAAAAFGDRRVSQSLKAGAPALRVEYGANDAAGRPREATVTVERAVEGTLEIRRADEHGRDQVVSKSLRNECAQQVVLRRMSTPDDLSASRWHVVSVSAVVGLTPAGSAALPLVDLDTHAVSSGFLSTQSDVSELAAYPQTCAVTAPGDSVRVFVGGLDADAAVCVFAGGTRVAAVRRDASHAEATVRVDGAGLGRIGVTVYSGRTLSDAAAPADTRTWVLPIMVGAPPPRSQEWFAL